MNTYIISYGLTIIAFIITMGAQLYINSTYSEYRKIRNKKNMTGKDAALNMLKKNGLSNIKVEEVAGNLTDHYDPSKKVIRLSTDIYNGATIAAVAVACHECGHAIQDKEGYFMLRLRHALVPFANISSYAGYIAIVVGVLLSSLKLVWLGIIAEIVILLFQLVTLPVEFNASSRALKNIEQLNILDKEELNGGRAMLTSAALTYVASVAATILEILRLVLIFARRDDNN